MNDEKSINLNKNQFLAVQMIATGKSGKAIAEALRVTPETISRWQQLPQFKAHLSDILCELKTTTAKRLSSLIIVAVDAIEDGFNDTSLSSRDRFVMGIKFLELCGKHKIELKTKDITEDEHIKRLNETTMELLAQKREQQKQLLKTD